MKKVILSVIFSTFFLTTFAQEISLNIRGTAPDFNYTSISDYENPKVAENAIRLDIETKKKSYSVSFRSDGPIRMNSGQSIPESKFGIRIHNTVPVVPLSFTNDQLLIKNDKNDKDDESYYLDFIVSPLFYDFDPGSYVVNILFTLIPE